MLPEPANPWLQPAVQLVPLDNEGVPSAYATKAWDQCNHEYLERCARAQIVAVRTALASSRHAISQLGGSPARIVSRRWLGA
jgi:hypothetical protein